MWSFGTNVYGQLGRPSNLLRGGGRNPSAIANDGGFEFVRVSAGDFHTAAVDREGRMFCWGKNTDGQCGQDRLEHEKVTRPTIVEALRDRVVTDVACGGHHTLALTQNGEVFVLGAVHGISKNHVPTQIPFRSNVVITQISCGWAHCACIADNGQVYTFGSGAFGRLGTGDRSDVSALHPELCSALPTSREVRQVALGMSFSVFLLASGEVYTLGDNAHGQLGRKTSRSLQLTAGKVEGLDETAVCVAAAFDHAAAVTDEGRCFTWGGGARGKLGHGDTDDRAVPTFVEAMRNQCVVSVACGSSHTVIVSDSGIVYVCGNSSVFFLGVGNISSTFVPQPITGPAGIRYAACGEEHTVLLEGSVMSRLGQDLGKALNVPDLFADIAFKAQDRVIYAHKCILRQSPYFARLIGEGSTSSRNEDDGSKGKELERDDGAEAEKDEDSTTVEFRGPEISTELLSHDTLLATLRAIYTGYTSGLDISRRLDEFQEVMRSTGAKLPDEIRGSRGRLTRAVTAWVMSELLGQKDEDVAEVAREPNEADEASGNRGHESFRHLTKAMRKVLQSGVDSDVVFVLEGDRIPAHKLILSCRCPYYATMFKAGMREARADTIPINEDGLDGTIIRHLLEYIYADRLSPSVTPDDTIQLLDLSERYGLPGLKFLCESELINSLDIHTAHYVLECARTYRALSLEANCLDYLVRNWFNIKQVPEVFEKIDSKLAQEISEYVRRKESY